MTVQNAKFFVGQVIKHRLFGYRGVIFDVDSQFQGTEEWYNQIAKSRPPKDKPWYRVLVHNNIHETYVAERNLEPDDSGKPIEHPFLSVLFNRFENGMYHHTQRSIN
jgi:heat shock protein HspQ